MLEEIYRALQKHKIEEVPNKVPNKSEITILKLLADKPSLTRAELAEQTGFSDSGIKKIINSLKSNNWIERHGSNKSGEWIVNSLFMRIFAPQISEI